LKFGGVSVAKMLDNVGVLTPDDFKLSVGLGHHQGWRLFRKFGLNNDVDSGTEEVWPLGTPRVLAGAAGVAAVSSDSANDAAAGTGARTVTLEGLDASFDEITETVTMNGVTPVNTSASFLRVNRAYNVTAGSGKVNAGNISISIGGNTQVYIPALFGQTQQTHYTVPAGHTVAVTYLTIFTGRLSTADVTVRSQVRLPDTDAAWRSLSGIFPFESQFLNAEAIAFVPEKSEVRQEIITSLSNVEAGSVWGGFLIDNDYLGS
jgi:hypothetical protein